MHIKSLINAHVESPNIINAHVQSPKLYKLLSQEGNLL